MAAPIKGLQEELEEEPLSGSEVQFLSRIPAQCAIYSPSPPAALGPSTAAPLLRTGPPVPCLRAALGPAQHLGSDYMGPRKKGAW